MISESIKQSLLKNELILFTSDYGKKGVAESWTVRLSKQVKKLDQFKDFENYIKLINYKIEEKIDRDNYLILPV